VSVPLTGRRRVGSGQQAHRSSSVPDVPTGQGQRSSSGQGVVPVSN
jgi:hypothetical protein